MEQLFTIPVNEAFEKAKGCPFCRLKKKLEKDEIDLILGASMMEPEIRKKTNAQGFCSDHFNTMLTAGKKLPVALILESHLSEINSLILNPGIAPGFSAKNTAKNVDTVVNDCYICNRTNMYLEKMFETAAYLFRNDPDFKLKLKNQPYFCLPHFAKLLSIAKNGMDSKSFAEFYKIVYSIEENKVSDTSEKVSFFAKKFDYRFRDEPWNGAENAPEDAVSFLSGDINIED